MKYILPVFFYLSTNLAATAQSDIQVGNSYQLNIQRQNQHADAFLLHNAKYSSTEDNLKWETTNANFGSRGIRFSYGASKGIFFYADGINAQAGTEFTPSARMLIRNDGFVGIGTTTPTELLQVGSSNQRGLSLRLGERASFGLSGTHAETVVGNNAIVVGPEVKVMNTASGASAMTMKWNDGIHFYTTNSTVTAGQVLNSASFEKMRISPNDGVFAEQVTVQLRSAWPDYVFDKDYHLQTLPEVEEFIRKNRHLPGIDSASALELKGINLGEMNAKLVEKIEEITLYLIEHNNTLLNLSRENERLKERIANLEKVNSR